MHTIHRSPSLLTISRGNLGQAHKYRHKTKGEGDGAQKRMDVFVFLHEHLRLTRFETIFVITAPC